MVHITTRKAVKRLLKMTEPTGSTYKKRNPFMYTCICTGSVILYCTSP